MIKYVSDKDTGVTTAEFVEKNGNATDWKVLVRNKLSKIMHDSPYIRYENFWNKINIGVNGIHTKVEIKCLDKNKFNIQKEREIARSKLLNLLNTAYINALKCANRYIENNSHNTILKNNENIALFCKKDEDLHDDV